MTLEANDVFPLLKDTNVKYGYVYENPGQYLDPDKYVSVDIWSEPIQISGLIEHSLAEKIAKKNCVELIYQDFTPGGVKARYEPVYAVSCRSIEELQKGIQNIRKAAILGYKPAQNYLKSRGLDWD